MTSNEKTGGHHELTIVEGGVTTIRDVKSVPSFDSTEVEVVLGDRHLKITGEGLEIDKLDTETSVLTLTGNILTVDYTGGGRKRILGRLFK